MAKDLPQFQQTVQLQPQALPDRQTAISNLGNKLSQFGIGVAKMAQSRSKEDLAAEKSAAQIQIRDGISRIREGVLDPSKFNDGATDSYDAQVNGLAKGVLNTADPKIKPFIANFVSYYGDKNRNVVATRVNSLKKNQLIGGLQEYNTKTTDDAINAKLSDEVTPDPEDKTKSVSKGDVLISQINQRNNAAMNSGLITPKEAFTYKEAAHHSYEVASYAHQFQKVLANQKQNPQKWMDSLNKNKSINPAIKKKVQVQAVGAMNQMKQSQDTQTNLIKQQADDTIRQVGNGTIDINSPHVSNVRLRTGALPEEDQQGIEHRLTAASVLSVTKKEMKWLPVMQRQKILKIMEPASDDPGFKDKDKINSALEAESNKLQEQFKKDSFGYVSDNPDVTHAFEARMAAANDGVTKIQPAQLQTINPLDVALDKERMMGANDQQLSVMKNENAATLVSHLDSLPDTKSKVQFINDVYDSYGKHKLIAGRDLKKAGAPQNILDLANLNHIPAALPYLDGIYNSVEQKPAIEEALKNRNISGQKTSDFKQAATVQLQSLMNTFGNTTDSEQFKNNMVDLVATSSAGYFLQGKTSSVDDASKKMANAIYNSRYSGIVKEARIPVNVSMTNAKNAMFAMEKDIKNVPFSALSRPAEGDESRIMRILHDNSDKNFVQRILKPEGKPTLDLGDGNFATHKMSWATTDGKPIVFPNVIQDAKTGKLKELSSKDAIRHAIKTKQFITAKDNNEAEWFSSNYKKVWNMDGKNITLKKGIPSGLTKGQQLQEDMDSIQAGHWRSISDDSGLYWVDAHGFTPQYIKAGTKTRYEIKWKDLQDQTSELNGLIAKHKRKIIGLF